MAAAPSKPLKNKWRPSNRTLAILGVSVALVILLAPRLVSTKRFYEPFVKSLARDKLHLEVGGVKLRWFRPIEISDVVISDLQDSGGMLDASGNGGSNGPESDSPRLLTIKSIRTDRGLISHLLSGRSIGRIEIIEPKIDISLIEDSSNLERLVQSLRRAQEKQGSDLDGAPSGNVSGATPEFPKLDFEIVVRNATVQVDRMGNKQPLAIVPPFSVESMYRGLGTEPHVRVLPAKILDRVTLSQELVRLGLGKAVPLLAKSTWFDGSVSLDIGELNVPLNDPIAASGSANIQMHQVRTGPSEPLIVNALEAIAKMRQKEPSLELVFVNDSNIALKLENHRVYHEGLQAGFPKIDDRLQISSSGSVGLVDKSLDLAVEVPVPVEQLARRDVVKEIGVPRVQLPVRGTLDRPEIAWAAMREDSGAILAMVATKLQTDAPILSSVFDSLGGVAEGDADEAIHATIDFVKSIRDARRKAREEQEQEQSEAPANKKPARRPILDALRQALE